MIKILEDLLIDATTNPNVPGSLVAGLRKAVDTARAEALPLWPRRDKAGKVYDLPVRSGPLDGSFVCVREHDSGGSTVRVGNVVTISAARMEGLAFPDCWLRCDKDGWVSCLLSSPEGLETEWRGHPGLSDWRPLPPKPSAIDEMAEQMTRWAAPTREDFDKAVNDLSEAMGVPKRRLLGQAQEAAPALAVQEGGSHYKDMKIQPVEYIHANGLGYFEGNVVKYVSRWRAKGGLQDLKKARHYVDLLIELEGDTK